MELTLHRPHCGLLYVTGWKPSPYFWYKAVLKNISVNLSFCANRFAFTFNRGEPPQNVATEFKLFTKSHVQCGCMLSNKRINGQKVLEEQTHQDYLRRTEREQHGALSKPSASLWQTHGLSPEGGGAPALLSRIHWFIITESDVAKRHFPSGSIRLNLIKSCQIKFFDIF